MTDQRLLIVYNADAGIAAGIKDSFHKLLSPDTYPCSLCALTHGMIRMDPRWKRFLARVPLDVRVYHRPDFRERYPGITVNLPAIFVERQQHAELLIGVDELAAIGTINALIARIEASLDDRPAPINAAPAPALDRLAR